MRTLHFHPWSGFHKPQWLSQELHWPHILSEPGFWAAVLFIGLIVIASLLAIFGPSYSDATIPHPLFYP